MVEIHTVVVNIDFSLLPITMSIVIPWFWKWLKKWLRRRNHPKNRQAKSRKGTKSKRKH